MPIAPKFEWMETEKDLRLCVSVNQTSVKGIDIEITDAFLKVNAAPYLLALDLYEDIDSTKAVVKFQDGKIDFLLPKRVPRLWTKLRAEGDKTTVLKRRLASLEDLHERVRCAQAASFAKRKADVKIITDKKIQTERKKREIIAAAKEAELEAERQSLLEWKQDLDIEKIQPNPALAENPTQRSIQATNEEEQQITSKQEPIDVMEEITCNTRLQNNVSMARRTLFRPVQVEFTELQTPVLPARENRERELKLYKAQINSEKLSGSEEELPLVERHPQYLKDKADAFYKQGNYQSAISAYSKAIEADQEGFRCYANRAASYFAIEDYSSCVSDCSSALEVLTEQIEQNVEQEEDLIDIEKIACKLLHRSAAANSKLGNQNAAQIDLKKAKQYEQLIISKGKQK